MKIMKTWTAISAALAVLTMGALGYVPLGIATAEDKNIEQMITAAKTPADHKAVAVFYQAEGATWQREAEQHAALAKTLVSEAGGQNPSASHHYERAEHCRKLADSLGQAAREAQSLAKIHESIAQSSTKGQ
jgi:hypothetical protein